MTDQHYGAHGSRPVWLGIDPGVTTGWALVEPGPKVIGSGNFAEDDLKHGLDTIIRAAHNEGYALRCVIERVPRSGIGRLAMALQRVGVAVREVVEETYDLDVIEVMPGEWKPSRVAKTTPLKRGKFTPHQRDAIRMTLYTMDREERHGRA